MSWRTTCRCGAKLAFSCEDIATGQPAEGADFFCMDPEPDKGPHDYGVVVYEADKQVRMITVAR